MIFSLLVVPFLTGVQMLAHANNWIPESAFLNDHGLVARSAAPKFIFATGELCYPRPAENGNGQQARISIDECWEKPLAAFPTYYLMRKCTFAGGVVRWRMVFDVYFPYSTNYWGGHLVDWEYVVIGFSQVPEDPRYWRRENIILGAHGHHTKWNWADYPRTVYGSNINNIIRNADHPVVYVGWDGHPMLANPDRSTKDSYFAPWWVRGAHYLNNDWDWRGYSAPATFNAGGSRDICNLG